MNLNLGFHCQCKPRAVSATADGKTGRGTTKQGRGRRSSVLAPSLSSFDTKRVPLWVPGSASASRLQHVRHTGTSRYTGHGQIPSGVKEWKRPRCLLPRIIDTWPGEPPTFPPPSASAHSLRSPNRTSILTNTLPLHNTTARQQGFFLVAMSREELAKSSQPWCNVSKRFQPEGPRQPSRQF